VQSGVNDEEQALFDAVVDVVNVDPCRRDLQLRGDPDDKDADVDEAK
jgi:hypothetical protein